MSEREKVCKAINDALKDEEKAEKVYSDMFNSMWQFVEQYGPSAEKYDKCEHTLAVTGLDDLTTIQADERRHRQKLERIKNYYCPI